jgi:hypothetical protein
MEAELTIELAIARFASLHSLVKHARMNLGLPSSLA